MKKLLTLSALSFLLYSCSPKIVPLKNQYPASPLTFETTSPVDSVWNNIIDFMATTGMSIKIIDRSSGLLITEDYSFKNVTGYEKPKTNVIDKPNAYLVSSWYQTQGGPFGPEEIMANWNVRIKPIGNGTTIAINITNVRAKHSILGSNFDVRSTGVFEQMVFDKVK